MDRLGVSNLSITLGASSSRDLKRTLLLIKLPTRMPTSANMGSKLNLEGMMLFEQPFARVSRLSLNSFTRC